jgi:hypothetical protein
VFLVHSVFHGSEAGLGLVAQMYVSQGPLTGSAQEQQVSARKKKVQQQFKRTERMESKFNNEIMEVRGIEPRASRMRSERSTI